VRVFPTGASGHIGLPLVLELVKNGFSAYVGDGSARWPAVHGLDAARLYRLVVGSAPAGSCWHETDDGGGPFRAICRTVLADKRVFVGAPIGGRQ
jgi:hypothetical protein